MAHVDHDKVRLELLRTRAALERAQLSAAVAELRGSVQPWYGVLSTVTRITQGAGGPGLGSLARTVFRLVRGRPLLFSTLATLAARRGARRWLLLGGVAMLCALWVSRAKRAGGEAGPSESG